MSPAEADAQAITVHLDRLLAEHGMTLAELSDRVGVSVVNLSILKNGRARAIRFTTLAVLCEVLGCQPGDLLGYQRPGSPAAGAGGRPSAGHVAPPSTATPRPPAPPRPALRGASANQAW